MCVCGRVSLGSTWFHLVPGSCHLLKKWPRIERGCFSAAVAGSVSPTISSRNLSWSHRTNWPAEAKPNKPKSDTHCKDLQRSAKQSSGVKRQLRRVGEQKYVFYMQKSRSLGMPCRCPRSCNMQRKHTKTYKAPKAPKAPKHLIGLVGLLRLVWLDLQSPVLMSCCKS